MPEHRDEHIPLAYLITFRASVFVDLLAEHFACAGAPALNDLCIAARSRSLSLPVLYSSTHVAQACG
jgi:hypothetical protein